MPTILLILALLAALTHAESSPSQVNNYYLSEMCWPNYTADSQFKSDEELVAILSQSPFPCEQQMYLSRVCMSNGTTLIDFLAEQQCFCGGSYFEAVSGCFQCQIAHGAVGPHFTSLRNTLPSVSKAECMATPVTQPYTNLFPTSDIRSVPPDASLTADRFANDTRVENYWTGPTAPIAGKITGSATARLTSYTNTGNVRYTPTGGGTQTGAGAGGSPTTLSSSMSTAGAAEVKVARGLLAVMMGAIAAL